MGKGNKNKGRGDNTSGTSTTKPKNTKPGKNLKLDVVTSDCESNDSLYEDNACPCNLSDTTSWKLVCTKCNQTWHSSCANIKGIPKQFITSLELWLCPWCFVVPFPKPQSYFTETVIEADGSTIYNFSKEFQKLSHDVTKTVSDSNINVQNKLVDLDTKFNDLSTKLNNLEQFKSELIIEPNYVQNSDDNKSQPNLNSTHGEVHIDKISENFLDINSCNELTEYFKNCEFTTENGHSVISYGQPYRYTGSRSEPTEFPPIISSVVDKINEQYNLDGNIKINSCLVNKFTGPDSFLNEHSDDEMNINPESSIFTISLGDPRSITFRNLNSGDKFEHQCSNGALYSMTRKSQNYFKHQISPDENFTGVRYSMTFRVVHWYYWNSTCLLGDSNTKHIKFGSERGCLGPATPGEKFFAPTINKIDPHKCVAYNNVVIMCGINNIKLDSVRNPADMRNIFCLLKSKVESITKLNPKAKIFIVPILPTKSAELNKKAIFFNQLIFRELEGCNFRVNTVHGLNSFVGPDGLLSRDLSRPQLYDLLHINEKGTRCLAECIKTTVFQGKKKHSWVKRDRTYADKAGGGSHPL
ncbi:MAG: alpha-ketoglutarate-dependent dioxygenase AlkB [Saccharospirillaceae bacterium]|nr:alpha-ketoglutarate-dependent dioxygenase AlkB [Saccharospirillaceae bacterium]